MSTLKTQLFTALAFHSGHLRSEKDYVWPNPFLLSTAIETGTLDKEQLSSNSSSVLTR